MKRATPIPSPFCLLPFTQRLEFLRNHTQPMNASYIELIRSLPIFAGYTEHGAKRLLDLGSIEEYPAGHVLFKEGDPPDSVLLVLEGKMSVFVERNGGEVALTESGPGTVIGELAVLGRVPRSACVRTAEPSKVLKWTSQSFNRLLLGDSFLSQRIFAASIKMLVAKERSLIEALVKTQQKPS